VLFTYLRRPKSVPTVPAEMQVAIGIRQIFSSLVPENPLVKTIYKLKQGK
jgi:hypothetical protein